ncbi:hypothetical protein RFI_12256 [Reticulomyxa filosa]|uniref:Cytochrome P450 n=1 Tax=Reticulomyxa filosa TaxID=46433 RepID=X6NG26_RETFI|nr:hypothetical protein RFI_12256 [Reticulomyxa filosa]|eukprot:ETO24901.1 hypothetical protein RFI_12256 [Reticulomyxa filosa]
MCIGLGQPQHRTELAKQYDLISLFLNEEVSSKEKLSEKELRDIAINFIIAGRDTTASLLTWTCYELSLYPEIQDNILNELKSVVGITNDKDLAKLEGLTFEHISKLTYLEAVLLEALRLHPSVPTMLRFAQEDIKMPGGEIIRKGDGIVIFSFALARLEKLWPNPLEFNPKRFLDCKEPHPAYYYPFFNVQPRLCLGKHVALMEAKIAIAKIIVKYHLKLKQGQKFTPVFSATLQLKEGMEMFFVPRKGQTTPLNDLNKTTNSFVTILKLFVIDLNY